MRSNQNSMRSEGSVRTNQAVRLREDSRKWIKKKNALTPREIRWVRLRMAVLRAASVLSAFYVLVSIGRLKANRRYMIPVPW